MKSISVQQLEGVIEIILHDKEELSKLKKEQFNGVTQDDVLAEIKKRLGDNWILKREPPVKFSKDDIAAVANSRFYRKVGVKLLMAWAIVVLAFAILTLTLRILPLQVYYGLSIAVTVGFLYIFSRKQKIVRDELKQAVYGNDRVEADRG